MGRKATAKERGAPAREQLRHRVKDRAESKGFALQKCCKLGAWRSQAAIYAVIKATASCGASSLLRCASATSTVACCYVVSRRRPDCCYTA
jgi:hypothetical protein